MLVAACLCVLVPVADASAEDLSISASVRQRSATVGSEVTLSVVVTGSGLRSMPDPVLPQIENAGVYSAGKSTSISTTMSAFSGMYLLLSIRRLRGMIKKSLQPSPNWRKKSSTSNGGSSDGGS